IMPGADEFVQAYNTQIAVEPDFQWIVGQRATQATNDKQQLAPTVKAIEEQLLEIQDEVLIHRAYCPDAPETADQGGSCHLLQAQNGSGAGVWTDQTSARHPAISLANTGEGGRRVG